MTSAFSTFEQPAWFDGQRLTAADLTAAQALEQEHRWLHNRALHAPGIVTGYAVTGVRDDRTVRVGPGLAIDERGREVILAVELAIDVPAVAGDGAGGPAVYVLTAEYEEAPAALERRDGDCGTAGAVRIPEHALVRWRRPADVDETRQVVLATAEVRGCALAAGLEVAARVEQRPVLPWIAAGSTSEGATQWSVFAAGGAPVGLQTVVPTGSGRFTRTPAYQARVAGPRELVGGGVADGPTTIINATRSSFTLRMLLPGTIGGLSGPVLLNPPEVRDPGFPAVARSQLGWHVVWLGVET